mmetsp:Transcript_11085/g.27072  ORF Transcript_11085/g.27072 Transcript_11085/m.27072 type:complete len:283 (-) Transcript_11085:1722-2570(-)
MPTVGSFQLGFRDRGLLKKSPPSAPKTPPKGPARRLVVKLVPGPPPIWLMYCPPFSGWLCRPPEDDPPPRPNALPSLPSPRLSPPSDGSSSSNKAKPPVGSIFLYHLACSGLLEFRYCFATSASDCPRLVRINWRAVRNDFRKDSSPLKKCCSFSISRFWCSHRERNSAAASRFRFNRSRSSSVRWWCSKPSSTPFGGAGGVSARAGVRSFCLVLVLVPDPEAARLFVTGRPRGLELDPGGTCSDGSFFVGLEFFPGLDEDEEADAPAVVPFFPGSPPPGAP